MDKQELERLMIKARTSILLADPNLTVICLLIPHRGDETLPHVAFTNGKAICLGKRWFTDYSPQEQAFIYLHEVSHIILRHVQQAQRHNLSAEDQRLHNIATDAVINYMIAANFGSRGIKTPKDAIDIRKITSQIGDNRPYEQWTSWELFLALKEHVNQQNQKQQSQSPLNSLLEEEDGDFELDLRPDSDIDSGELTDDQRKFADLPAEMQDLVMRKLLEAGRLSSGFLRSLCREIPIPRINWQGIVRRFLKQYCSPKYEDNWRRPNRLSLSGAIDYFEPARRRRPSLYRVAWIIDTSGSMSEEDITQGLSLIISCRKQYDFELIILSADAEVCSRQVFSARADIAQKVRQNQVQLKGGGGTDFRPALEAVKKEKPTLVFYFSDGMGEFPDRVDFPLIWLMTTDVQAPVGQTVNINKLITDA